MPAAAPALPLRDRRFRQWGIPALALLIALFSGAYREGPGAGARFAVSWGVALYFTAGLWLGNRALWGWLLRRLPRVDQTGRRLWALAGLSVVFTGAATLLLVLPLHWALPQWFPLRPAGLWLQMRFNLLPTVAVQTLYEAIYFFQQWQENQRRADRLAQAQTQAQLDALAQQLDPHFLFNSLNTLAALIDPADAPAQQYVEGLADVYRYVLLSRERPTVPLAEELAFVRTYVALQKVRFRDNVQVRYDVPPGALARRVAPLSVQLLVENALKHNEASQARPLHLRLVADAAAGALRVENTWQPRPAGLAPSTGLGLANVRRRYALLGAPQPVAVAQEAGLFAVTLPLLGE